MNQQEKAQQMRNEGISIAKISRELEVGKTTVRRWLDDKAPTSICPYCQKEFKNKRWDRNQKFCSVECRGLSQRKEPEKRICGCGREWETFPSDQRKYCSTIDCPAFKEAQEIGLASSRGKKLDRIVRNCLHCGKVLSTTEAVDKKYCDMTCFRESQKKPEHAWRCPKCGIVKQKNRFTKQGYWCKKCLGLASKKWQRSPEGKYKMGINESRKRGYKWEIELDDYKELISHPCVYCGLELSQWGVGLDRMDNNKDYTIDNVVPCCGRCNLVKHSFFTFEEMLKLGKTIQEIDYQRNTYASDGAI